MSDIVKCEDRKRIEKRIKNRNSRIINLSVIIKLYKKLYY